MKNYRYDFYIQKDGRDILIELDGVFHDRDEQIQRDIDKNRIAKQHDFEVLRVDCKYTTEEPYQYVKQHIVDSDLRHILPLESVDWDLCYKLSTTNLVQDVCDLWEQDDYSTTEIAQMVGICPTTVRAYLKRGLELGICPSYNHQESDRRGNLYKSSCVAFTLNNVIQYVFRSAQEVSDKSTDLFGVKYTKSQIHKVCCGDLQTCGGLCFRHISLEEYRKYKRIIDPNCDFREIANVGSGYNPILVIDQNNMTYAYRSILECINKSKQVFGKQFYYQGIYRALRDYNNTYCKKHFKYITNDEYLQYKMIEKDKSYVVVKGGDIS